MTQTTHSTVIEGLKNEIQALKIRCGVLTVRKLSGTCSQYVI